MIQEPSADESADASSPVGGNDENIINASPSNSQTEPSILEPLLGRFGQNDDDDDAHYMGAYNRTPFMESPVRFFQERFEAGSLKGSVFTLVVAIVGAGTLSVPFAIQRSGLLFGIGLFVGGAILAIFSLQVLLIASQHSGAMSYNGIALRTYGPGMSIFTQLVLLTNLYGTTISYVVAAGNMISTSLHSILRIDEHSADSHSVFLRPSYVMVAVVLFPTAPLALLRNLGSLRFSSLLAVGFVGYLVCVVTFKYLQYCTSAATVTAHLPGGELNHQTVQCFWESSIPGTDPIVLASGDADGILNTIPIVIYAYTCHPNVLPVFLELRLPNRRRMDKVAQRAIGIAMVIYLVTGSFAYLTFRSQLTHSDGNFLLNDYHDEPSVMFGAIGMSCSVILAIPIMIHAFRSNLYNLINGRTSEDGGAMPARWHYGITLVMLTLVILPAVALRDISKVFAVLGATTNPVICLVLPTMFMVRAVPKSAYMYEKAAAIVVSIMSVGVSVVSLVQLLENWTS